MLRKLFLAISVPRHSRGKVIVNVMVSSDTSTHRYHSEHHKNVYTTISGLISVSIEAVGRNSANVQH